ncbi:MAG TPA: C1 family peptidase [Candidatus Binatia bacterium]|nr:C1 family peptidase [Candidatus Binatia bacterium]
MRLGRLVVAVVLAAGVWPAAAKKPKPTPCPGGTWVVPGGPLIAGVTDSDTIDVNGQQVSLGTSCAAAKARRQVSRKKTILQVHWRTCGSAKGGTLVLQLAAPACDTIRGVFTPRKGKAHRFKGLTVQTPPDAFGHAGGTLPNGFTLVDPATGQSLLAGGQHHSADAQTQQMDAQTADQLAMDDESLVQQFITQNPDMADHYTPGVDPADIDGGIVTPTDDGNYLMSINLNQALVTPALVPAVQNVLTLGRRSQLALIANALRIFPTMDNQTGQYDSFFDFFTANSQYTFIIDRLSLPPKDQAHQMSVSDLITLNNTIGSYLQNIIHQLQPPPGGTPPAGYPASCNLEEHAGDMEDQTGGSCSHTAHGAYDNYFWPQKFYQTCVKNQGSRGTCVAFGIDAAMEAAIAKKYNRWVNLSEQHLYYMAKAIWWPSTYGDGLGTHGVWQRMISESYVHPWEDQWEYNPSYSRTADDKTMTYTHSCTGYTGPEQLYCSDTNHQGYPVCFDFLLFRFCYYLAPPVGGGSGFQAVSETELWDSSDVDNSFAKILWAVALFGKPVVLGIAVPPSFDNPNADGYVTSDLPHCGNGSDGKCHTNPGVCECDRGGHAVEVVGWIDNPYLPANAPPAPTDQSSLDGGYLIIKNSWGKCFADAGYIYLPYRWVKNMTYSATVLGDIN